ncbi:MAG: hypothetical protein NTW74_05675 [Acidobacteria bacterium]|nr:hypothetical protein [Acidobacteriota bacterium]
MKRRTIPVVKQGPFGRLLNHIQDFGLAGIHLRFLAGLNLYRKMSIFELDLDHLKPTPEAKIPVVISTDNTSEAATCYSAMYDGQIVSCLKKSEGSILLPYIAQSLHLTPNECYLHGAFTEPDFRSKGLLGALISYACQHTHHSRALVAITSYNKSSTRAFSKAGFKLKQIRGYYGLGPWRHHFAAQPAPTGNTRSSGA